MNDLFVLAGLISWGAAKTTEVINFLGLVAVAAGCVFVLTRAVQSRGALVPVLGALVVAGLVAWGVTNIDWIKGKWSEETGGGGGVVVESGR